MAAMVLAAFGCNVEEIAPGAAGQAIVGGDLDPDDRAVGMVWATDADGDHGMTGVLVAPNKVLTGPSWSAEGFTSAQFMLVGSDGWTVEHTYLAASSATDPDFDTENWNGGHAVTVLTLQVPVLATVATPVPLSSTAPAVSQAVRVVGFGQTSADDDSTGTKRTVATTITGVFESGGLFAYGDATHGGCFGDAGGPILHDDDSGEAIVGLAFYGTQLCDGPSHATRIDASSAFLEEQLGPIGPAAPDAGVPAVDAGGDDAGGDDGDQDSGCGCRAAPRGAAPLWLAGLLGLFGLARTTGRRRRDPRRPR